MGWEVGPVAVTVSSGLVRDWAYRALSGLGDARADIDALNVFPVPDGDTGTNLYLTMESACQSVDGCWTDDTGDGPPASAVAKALSTGALLGARGNSGVILSQLLRGTSEVLSGLVEGEVLDGQAVHDLLRRGAELSYQAVARPVEGTILTVARAAADAAQSALSSGIEDAAGVVEAAAQGAHDALARTPEMLESLRLAGVVDAGGRGLTVVLDALADAVAGFHLGPSVSLPPPTRIPPPQNTEAASHYGGPAYEVMFLLDAEDDALPALREALDGLGDSLVVVGGDRLWNVHVHVDDAGAAVEAAMAAGRPYRLRITHLEPVQGRAPAAARGVVAVAHGPGVAELLERAGVFVVPAKATQRPSMGEILAAVRLTHSDEVVVLPSDKDTRAVAESAAEEARREGTRVSVIPTRSVVQSLAAVAVHDPMAGFDEDVVAMGRAAGATRYAAVTVASREALTTAGPCVIGDILGLVNGDIVKVGTDIAEVARELLTGMLAMGGELVTLVLGEDADERLRDDLPDWLGTAFPLAEVSVHEGGQPLWPIIIGVE